MSSQFCYHYKSVGTTKNSFMYKGFEQILSIDGGVSEALNAYEKVGQILKKIESVEAAHMEDFNWLA